MREPAIKATVLNALREQRDISRASTLANEYPIGHTGIRADLAILADRFVGVEVKSEADSLRRLERQMSAYDKYFDRVILVVAERHMRDLLQIDCGRAEVWTLRVGGALHAAQRDMSEVAPALKSALLTDEERRRWKALIKRSDEDGFQAAFGHRYGATSSAFWATVGRKRIQASDLKLLSRLEPQRVKAAQLRAERDASWSQWGVAA